MALFGSVTGSKTKSKYSENQVQQNQIDPFFAQQGRDTVSMFNRLTGGVMNRYNTVPSQLLITQDQPYMADATAYGGGEFIEPPGGLFNSPVIDSGIAPPDSFVAGFGNTSTGAMDAIKAWQGSGNQIRSLAAGVIPEAIGGYGQVGQIGGIGGPATIGQISASQIAPIQEAKASTAREYMDQYFNPYLKDVVDTSLADYDVGADRTSTAARMRRDAGSAFGDRAAIADSVLGGELARGRGSLSANLRSNAFNTAANLGAGDAGRFTSVSLSNAGAANQRALAQSQLEMQSRLANLDTEGRNIDNRFRVDSANADIASRNAEIEAGNIDRKIDADKFNIDAKLKGTGISAGLIKDADATDLLAIKNRLEVGMMEDENAQARLSEPLELINQKLALLSGLPYDTTTTTNTKGKSSGTNIGFSIKNGN